MNHRLKTSGKLLMIVLMISTLLTSCSLLPSNFTQAAQNAQSETVTISKDEYERLQRYSELDELLQIVQTYYYQEPDVDAMIENAERGLLYALEDPYTYYYNAKQYSDMWADDEGEYAGIGIQIMASYETLLCTVSRVFQDSPALEAGIRKGDILKTVEDIDVTAYTLQDAVDIMRGEEGKPVKIQIQRGDEVMDLSVVRAHVKVDWVNGTMLDNDIGYITLYEFSGDCAAKFQEKLAQLQKQGMKGLIIDLRDNPGGWVDDAIKIADLFLPECTITYLENRAGEREYYTATDGKLEIPMVILMNENSASASEILAGAMQDYKLATIVGTQSFGKGIVQYVLPVGQKGAGMQLTTAQYYTPNGNVVHKVGITPDVESKMPEGDTGLYELGDLNDAQLAQAVQVMMEKLNAPR